MNNPMSQVAPQAFGSLSEKVFLAGFDGERVTLHVSAPKSRRALRAEARAALSRAGVAADCRVVPFHHARIEGAESLQALVRCFGGEGLVYDPTGSVTRAQALVRCAERLRSVFGESMRGLYVEPDTRALYLVYRQDELLSTGAVDEARRQNLQTRSVIAMESWRREDAAAFDVSVQLCLEAPKLALVAVDDASRDEARGQSWWNLLRKGMVGLGAVVTAAFAGQAQAQGPAVSGINGKLALDGGAVNTHATGDAQGTLTVPLGHSFGAQLDITDGVYDKEPFSGGSGQAFWRDPEIGLIGGFASHLRRNLPIIGGTENVNDYGAEAEVYAGKVTISGVAGGERGQLLHSAFGSAMVAWYPIENLKLDVGGQFLENVDPRFLLGFEYQPGFSALPGLSVFADGEIANAYGQHGGSVQSGFRYYFGHTKTLIKRHREDTANVGQLDAYTAATRAVLTGQQNAKNHSNHY